MLLRCAHAFRQLTATLGAYPQVHDKPRHAPWLLSRHRRALRQRPVLSLYWNGVMSSSEELYTDLLMPMAVLVIVIRLLAELGFQNSSLESKTRW
jgi:hypothetical protein